MHKTKQNKTISWSLHSHGGSSRFSCEGRPLPLRPEGDVVGARSHEPARCASGTVARMRSSPVDPVYGFPGLQTAVCYETTQIQRRVGFYGQVGFGTNPRGRNIVPAAKTSDQRCPERASPTGFLLPLFSHSKARELVPRPILDLRVLNRHLRKYTFRMLTHKVLCRSIRPGDWFVTIDLSDAYFHIAIHPAHRKFLRFAFQNRD